ncbi:MAG: cupin domain-containing protein [Acidobacteria bacterium]|nr:MAG: cupin domain-containing protein [Acidobacteriota bacterium]
MNRREMCSLLPAALALNALAVNAFAAEGSSMPSVAFRQIVKGKLATGEEVEMHETMLDPGGAPHPPHHHPHSEFWLIREGTVEITISGKPHVIGAGSAAYVASNEEHGIKNAGSTPAIYFVVAVGPGAFTHISPQDENKKSNPV